MIQDIWAFFKMGDFKVNSQYFLWKNNYSTYTLAKSNGRFFSETKIFQFVRFLVGA